jgi:hypothetical protein
VDGNISQIVLIVDIDTPGCESSSDVIESCSQEVCLKASALESDGTPIPGVTILFRLQNNTVGNNTFNASFSPQQDTTDANGEAFTLLRPSNDCSTECKPGNSCQAEVVASLQGNLFVSIPVPLSIDIQ